MNDFMIIHFDNLGKKDQFIKTPKIPKLNQNEIYDQHTHIASKNNESVNRKIPLKRNPQVQMDLLENFMKHLKKN